MSETITNYQRLNAVAANRLHELKGNPARLFILMLSMTDNRSGKVTIGSPFIQARLKTDDRSARNAMKELIRIGVCKMLRQGGGRHNVPQYQMLCPAGPSTTPLFDESELENTGEETGGNNAGVSEINGGQKCLETGGKNIQNGGQKCRKGGAFCPPVSSNKVTNTHSHPPSPTTSPTRPPASTAGNVCVIEKGKTGGGGGGGESTEVFEYLRTCGIDKPVARQLSTKLTKAECVEVRKDVVNNRTIRNRPAYFVSLLNKHIDQAGGGGK